MDLTIRKKKFTAVTSCTLKHKQGDGTDLLHLEMFQLVEEAIQHLPTKDIYTFLVVIMDYAMYTSMTSTDFHQYVMNGNNWNLWVGLPARDDVKHVL